MERKIERISRGTAGDGKEAHLFRIPNSTNDYIELSTRGCVLEGVCLHGPDGGMENVLAQDAPEAGGLLWAGEAGRAAVPPGAVWDVAETGENYVFLTCRAGGENGGITLGARVMWVNLNRLVADLFVTPERPAALDIRSALLLRTGGGEGPAALRTFCPSCRVDGVWRPAAETPYGALRFQPLTAAAAFAAPEGTEVRPMAELTGTAENLAVSVYGDLPEARFLPLEGGVRAVQTFSGPVALEGGQTCACRVIYGFDRIPPEGGAEEPLSPFGAFL